MTGCKVVRYSVLGALIIALGFVCYDLGQRGAEAYERLLVDRVKNGLAVLNAQWARIEADGLKLEFHGHAPDIASRELALKTARATAPLAEITDFTTATLAPPAHRDPVRVELLRDERGVTLTGQTATSTMRNRLNAALAEDAPQLTIHDLTGIQAAQPPRSFGSEIAVASLAASRLPNAYVVMEPGEVRVVGEVQDATERDGLTRELLARAVMDVSIQLDLSIPAQVIAPFSFAARKDDGAGIRLERCAARDTDEQVLILRHLAVASVEHQANPCPVGLGGPDGDWPGVIEQGLAALTIMPMGAFEVEYTYARLSAAAPTDAGTFDESIAVLRAALPNGYTLSEDYTAPPDQDAPAVTWFRADIGPGKVTLDGTVADDLGRIAVNTFAASLFGAEAVRGTLTVTDEYGLHDRQTVMMSVLGALGNVPLASAEITGTTLSVQASLATPAAARALYHALGADLPGYQINTRVRIDLPAIVAAIPLPGPRCAALLSEANRRQPIEFATGSGTISEASFALLDELATVFRRCDDSPIVIGGHTDSDGSKDYNRRLSQSRADAVAQALIARGVAYGRTVAQGYGEDQPIASNQTQAGRARNRRIEFKPAPPPEAANADPAKED